MVRNRKVEKKIALFTENDMRAAVELVVNQGMSLRRAAQAKNVNYCTLSRYVKKRKENENGNISMYPKYDCRRIFTDEQEASLEVYLMTCAKMSYGLDIAEARRLAFEMAQQNNIQVPESWIKNQEAGEDWMYNFRKRHPNISLRRPEACSLSRGTSFNPHNVGIFFDNLQDILNRTTAYSDGTRIFNLDETGTSTVQTPRNVLAPKGIKQLNKVTSGEKGTLVTTCCVISASGVAIPPVMVFPRVHFKEHMIKGAPPGTLGLATPSGWMNGKLFADVIRHFIKHTQASKENPALLILDNHESHLAIEALDIAKENGVTMLTIPPHCSNRIQPLDVSVFKSFQTHYNSAIDSWMLHHPGIPLSIYEVAGCVGTAFQRAMTPSNIMSGFRKCGIFPFDREVFTDDDFLCSFVTDRTLEEGNLPAPVHSEEGNLPAPVHSVSQPQTSSHKYQITASNPTSNAGPSSSFIGPEIFKGFPKAQKRKEIKGGRKRGKSCVATDTPVKEAIREKSLQRGKKKPKKLSKKLFDSDSENEDVTVPLASSDDEDWMPEVEDESTNWTDKPIPTKGDYILVKFIGKHSVFYVGKIEKNKDNDGDYEVTFLRKGRKNTNDFVYPQEPDIATVHENDIVMILPQPTSLAKTKRRNACLKFEVDLENYDIR